eukprot:364822-Chlamydomonas_euryale.AAC.1
MMCVKRRPRSDSSMALICEGWTGGEGARGAGNRWKSVGSREGGGRGGGRRMQAKMHWSVQGGSWKKGGAEPGE